MKTINFITALSPRRHKELTRWYQLSTLLLIAILAAITITTGRQYLLFAALNKQVAQETATTFTTTMNNMHALKLQEQELEKKLASIAPFATPKNNPAHILDLIHKTMSGSSFIESVVLDKTTITMVVLCAQTAQAMEIISSLQKLPELEGLTLQSLQPQQHAEQSVVRVMMKATLQTGVA